ncbi:MAG: hypothetical protein AAGI08_02870 [Bacteroidota bacterium]
MAQLHYIRGVMERAGTFTAVPGKGLIGVGALGLLAATISFSLDTRMWLLCWLAVAVVAVLVGGIALARKAHATNAPLDRGPGLKFLHGLLPAYAAGALLSLACWASGAFVLLPGLWLLLYGAGTITAGMASVAVVPALGIACMLLGAVALFVPLVWGTVLMGLGFGLAHIVAGAVITKRYGG